MRAMATEKKTAELRRRRKRHQEFIRSLRDAPCSNCGESYHFSSMKFVFNSTETKIGSFSKLALYSISRIQEEVKKYVLLCANCTNYRTFEANCRKHATYINRDFIKDLKIGKPCTDCGRAYHHSQMEFDHPLDNKIRNISKMQRYSQKRILEEVAKCELVCSNCHHLRTWKRLNHSSLP